MSATGSRVSFDAAEKEALRKLEKQYKPERTGGLRGRMGEVTEAKTKGFESANKELTKGRTKPSKILAKLGGRSTAGKVAGSLLKKAGPIGTLYGLYEAAMAISNMKGRDGRTMKEIEDQQIDDFMESDTGKFVSGLGKKAMEGVKGVGEYFGIGDSRADTGVDQGGQPRQISLLEQAQGESSSQAIPGLPGGDAELNAMGMPMQTPGPGGSFQVHERDVSDQLVPGGASATVVPWDETDPELLKRIMTPERYQDHMNRQGLMQRQAELTGELPTDVTEERRYDTRGRGRLVGESSTERTAGNIGIPNSGLASAVRERDDNEYKTREVQVGYNEDGSERMVKEDYSVGPGGIRTLGDQSERNARVNEIIARITKERTEKNPEYKDMTNAQLTQAAIALEAEMANDPDFQ